MSENSNGAPNCRQGVEFDSARNPLAGDGCANCAAGRVAAFARALIIRRHWIKKYPRNFIWRWLRCWAYVLIKKCAGKIIGMQPLPPGNIESAR